jgi:uncharacterized membrane protein
LIETCLSNPSVNCSFFLFQSGGTTVEINLVGAVLPLLFSLYIVFRYRKRLHWKRVAGFTLLVLAIMTAVGSAAEGVYHSIALPGWVYILLWAFMVATYSHLRFDKAAVLLTAGELYVVGTLGIFMDDVVRTFLGFAGVPFLGLAITPNIWGAAGPLDGIFMSGAYQVLIYLLAAALLSRKRMAKSWVS